MPPPSNVTRTGISLLLRVSISFLLLPPVLSPLSSSSLSWVTTSGTTGCESIFTRPEIDRPTEQLPEQPRAHEAATLSRSDPLWKKVCFRPYTWPFARRVSLPLRRRAMAAGNNRERSKRKRLRTTSLRSPLFFSFFFFSPPFHGWRWSWSMDLWDILVLTSSSLRFSFKETCSFFSMRFLSLFLEIFMF